jgi:hypothetical protein
MGGDGRRLEDRFAGAEQSDDRRRTWAPRRRFRRTLVAAYLLTLAAVATVGWIEALAGGVRDGDLTGTLWVALFVVALVEQAGVNKATSGRFTLRLQPRNQPPRAVADLGYRYGFRILAGVGTATLAVALYLPIDRPLSATNRMAWVAVAIPVVYLMWMLPTLVVGWTEPDDPRGG